MALFCFFSAFNGGKDGRKNSGIWEKIPNRRFGEPGEDKEESRVKAIEVAGARNHRLWKLQGRFRKRRRQRRWFGYRSETFEAQGRLALFGFFAKGNQGDFQSEEKSQGWFVQTRRLGLSAYDSRCGVEDATGNEEAANGLERRERETDDGRDADRRSFSGEVAGVIRNHRDGEARRRRTSGESSRAPSINPIGFGVDLDIFTSALMYTLRIFAPTFSRLLLGLILMSTLDFTRVDPNCLWMPIV
ncbi:hypothetical protein U1Q18_011614 [Sarracenia purpurea var. burkii]